MDKETTTPTKDAAPAPAAVDNGNATVTVKDATPPVIKATTDPKVDNKGTDKDKPADPKAADFRAGLAPELKDKYTEFKTPEDVLKGYDELVKKLGKNPLVVPGKDAKPEEVEAYKAALAKANGAPEKAEEYNFSVPEGVGEKDIYQPLVDKMRVIAHKHGVGAEAFKEMATEYLGMQAAFMQESADAGMSFEDATAALQAEWGTAYEARTKKADAFFSAQKGKAATLFREKFGNDPVAIQMFYEMAVAHGEDSPLEAGGGIMDTKQTLAEKQASLGELQNKPEYYNMMHAGHDKVRQEAAKLAAEIAALRAQPKK